MVRSKPLGMLVAVAVVWLTATAGTAAACYCGAGRYAVCEPRTICPQVPVQVCCPAACADSINAQKPTGWNPWAWGMLVSNASSPESTVLLVVSSPYGAAWLVLASGQRPDPFAR